METGSVWIAAKWKLYRPRFCFSASPLSRFETLGRPLIEAIGGKLHHLFFCFGAEDVIALVEAPDDKAMAAGALAIGASGAFSSGATTKLMTSTEAMAAMAAAKKAAGSYRPATG